MTSELINIFIKSIETVKPNYLIRKAFSKSSKCDAVRIRDVFLNLHKNCFVVGFGKAVYEMAVELENILGEHLQKGIISVPIGTQCQSQLRLKSNTVIRVIEGGERNLPDKNAYVAAQEIRKLTNACGRNDIIFVLISGGGSALLSYPTHPVTLEEKIETIKQLSMAGANIVEMNSVRIALSEIKGGKLAKVAYPGKTIALILSDIVGDKLNFIASGPTVLQDYSTPHINAISVLTKYNLLETVPSNVMQVLSRNCKEENIDKKIKEEHTLQNFIIGNNELALEAAKEEGMRMKCFTIVLSKAIEGSVSEIAHMYKEIIQYVCLFLTSYCKTDFNNNINSVLEHHKNNLYIREIAAILLKNADYIKNHCINYKSLCFIAGGEPTVRVIGNGIGGRNQQLALEMSIQLNTLENKYEYIKEFDIMFLSGGTDGIDGPTDAAGAIACTSSIQEACLSNMDAYSYLQNNDSYSFFNHLKNGAYLIKTGQTGTNVMDIHIVNIKFKR